MPALLSACPHGSISSLCFPQFWEFGLQFGLDPAWKEEQVRRNMAPEEKGSSLHLPTLAPTTLTPLPSPTPVGKCLH